MGMASLNSVEIDTLPIRCFLRSAYVLLCVFSTAGLRRIRFGAFERHEEVLSGVIIALVGLAFWIWPLR